MSNFNYEESNLPTMDDIRNLAMHEPIINNILTLHKKDQLTEREALILMVISMTESKNSYLSDAVKYRQNSLHRQLTPEPKRGGLVNPDGGDYPLKWMGQRRDNIVQDR